MSNSNEVITALEAAEILGITRAALCDRRKRGSAPAWTDLAPPEHKRPKVRYRLADVLALRDERAPERPSLVELAGHLATVGDRLATVEHRLAKAEKALVKVAGKRRKAIKRRRMLSGLPI